MDNRAPLDRELLIPILLGGFSVIGIIIVLLIGRSLNAPAQVAMTPSATPFQYVYLGTEPAISTPLVQGSESTPLGEGGSIDSDGTNAPPFLATATRSSSLSTPTPPLFGSTPTRSSSVSTPLILSTSNLTNTPSGNVLRTNTPGSAPTSTATNSTVAAFNTYDDTDPRLLYSGTWAPQTNVTGAHQGTLHVSNSIGDSVTFTFTGSEIHLFYQAGPSLGDITITIDGLGSPPISQSQAQTQIKEWVPTNLLSSGTHSIVITHSGGGSANIDSLVIPGLTPTPTQTSTPAQ